MSAEYRKLCEELDAIGVAVAEKAISDYGPAATDNHLLRTAIAEIFTEMPRVPQTIEERILWAAEMEIMRRNAS
jgi:hypothetical protein